MKNLRNPKNLVLASTPIARSVRKSVATRSLMMLMLLMGSMFACARSPGPDQTMPTPTIVSIDDSIAAYDDWKRSFLESCGDDSMRVRFDNPAETVSEGIAYGLLLSAYHQDKTTFDGLWAYYNNHLDPRGLMHWKINGCSQDALGRNAASDAELDAALALLVASCNWGENYKSDALALIQLIRQHETASNCGGPDKVLRPGDVWGGCGTTNPSYFSPAYYRVFADVTNDSFWTSLAEDSYVTLNQNAHPVTGLVSDWCKADGTPGNYAWSAAYDGRRYHYDAARTPWRIAVDYLWWQNSDAKTWLTTVTNWVNSVGIESIGDSYSRDGTKHSNNHNSTFVGAFACGAMPVSQEAANAFALDFKNIPSSADRAYFQRTLRAVYMLVLTDNFWKPACW